MLQHGKEPRSLTLYCPRSNSRNRGLDLIRTVADDDGNVGRQIPRRSHDMFDERKASGAMQDLCVFRLHAGALARSKD